MTIGFSLFPLEELRETESTWNSPANTLLFLSFFVCFFFFGFYYPQGPRYKDRVGGYTRVMKVGNRQGDGAPIAVIEFVDRANEIRPAKISTPEHVARNHMHRMPRFRDYLPSRNWETDPFIHRYGISQPKK